MPRARDKFELARFLAVTSRKRSRGGRASPGATIVCVARDRHVARPNFAANRCGVARAKFFSADTSKRAQKRAKRGQPFTAVEVMTRTKLRADAQKCALSRSRSDLRVPSSALRFPRFATLPKASGTLGTRTAAGCWTGSCQRLQTPVRKSPGSGSRRIRLAGNRRSLRVTRSELRA